VDSRHTDHGIVNCMHIGYSGWVIRGPHTARVRKDGHARGAGRRRPEWRRVAAGGSGGRGPWQVGAAAGWWNARSGRPQSIGKGETWCG
jgi:hypothetical protein